MISDTYLGYLSGVVFFDDEKGLQRCLSSIQSYVDLIIATDGKFKYFEEVELEWPEFLSNDFVTRNLTSTSVSLLCI